jgi:hypothetical protein
MLLNLIFYFILFYFFAGIRGAAISVIPAPSLGGSNGRTLLSTSASEANTVFQQAPQRHLEERQGHNNNNAGRPGGRHSHRHVHKHIGGEGMSGAGGVVYSDGTCT